MSIVLVCTAWVLSGKLVQLNLIRVGISNRTFSQNECTVLVCTGFSIHCSVYSGVMLLSKPKATIKQPSTLTEFSVVSP